MNPKALELQTAKEILAEVFRVRLSEVDEMIQNRFEAQLRIWALKKKGCGRRSSGWNRCLFPEPPPSLSPGSLPDLVASSLHAQAFFYRSDISLYLSKVIPYPG